jgi:hypothetical protein
MVFSSRPVATAWWLQATNMSGSHQPSDVVLILHAAAHQPGMGLRAGRNLARADAEPDN